MKTLFLLALFSSPMPAQVMLRASAVGGGSTKYCAPIVIDHTKVGAVDQTDYVTVFTGNADLKSTGNAGFVQNASGYDIGFYSTGDYSTGKLKWETVTWSASTGLGEWHIKIASVSHTVDTIYYACFGDPTITTDQSDRANTWPANLLSGLHLKDGSTLSLSDFSNNSYTFTNHSSVGATAGQVDGGASFAQASGKYLSNSSTFAQPAAITISVWAKATTLASGDGFNNVVGDSGSTGYVRLYVQNDGTTAAFFRTVGGTVLYIGGSHTLVTGTWYHIVATYSAANGLKVYVNGAADATASALGDLETSNPVTAVVGNDDNSSTTRNWDGALDEPRWYSVEQTADWITCNYNNQLNPNTFAVYGTKVSVDGGGGGSLAWSALTNGQWTGLTNGQWTGMTN